MKYLMCILFCLLSSHTVWAADTFQGIFSNYQHYLEYYDLDFPEVEKKYFKIQTASSYNEYQLFLQHFYPRSVKAGVILVHGYEDHSGRQKYILEYLLGKGFEVWMFDLPGHGLTKGGVKHGIDDFIEYVQMMEVVVELIGHTDMPLHLVAHSTGGAAVLEYLKYYPDVFDSIILAAPLIYHASHRLSYLAYDKLKGFVKEIPVPAVPGYAVNDLYTKRLILRDPLQAWVMNINYVKALFEWQQDMKHYPELKRPVIVLQGNKDAVVSWRDNLEFLKEHFSDLNIFLIRGAKHNLFMDHKWKRKQIFRILDKVFEAENTQ